MNMFMNIEVNNTYVILAKTALLGIIMLIVQVNRKPKNLLKLCGTHKNGHSPNSTNQEPSILSTDQDFWK